MPQKLTKKINGIRIDPKIFTFSFTCKCSGECCNYGVYTDYKEYKKIMGLKNKILPLLDESQTSDPKKWFEPPEKDEDFESGTAVGTELYNDKCTFLDKDGLCVLQKLAIKEGRYQWKYKPLYCILFPLTIYENMLTIDDEHIDRLKSCNRNHRREKTIFEACKNELRYFFGAKGFKELEKYKNEYLEGLKVNGKKN